MCQHIDCLLAHTESAQSTGTVDRRLQKPSQMMISCYDRSGSLEGIRFLLLLSSSDVKASHLSPESAYVRGHVCVLHVFVVVYRYACVHAVYASGGQRVMFDVFLYCSPLCLLKKGLSLNPELSCLARLSGSQDPGIFMSPQPQHWDYKHTPLVFCACVASTL